MILLQQQENENNVEYFKILKRHENDKVIAFAGNPNVGKSTLFNELTGMKQHTGNWPGKTVSLAQGYFHHHQQGYVLVDLPGCYSLMAHSLEEEVARNFLCFEQIDCVVVVCDATCLERNLNLTLQIMELCSNVILCVNLIDEAQKKQIEIDLDGLSKELNIPIIGCSAAKKQGIQALYQSFEQQSVQKNTQYLKNEIVVKYDQELSTLLKPLAYKLKVHEDWLALRIMDNDTSLTDEIISNFDESELRIWENALTHWQTYRQENHISEIDIGDEIVRGYLHQASNLANQYVHYHNPSYFLRERKLNRLFTGKISGFLIMFLLLLVIFYLTMEGANYPSQLLTKLFASLEVHLNDFLIFISLPDILIDILMNGVYRVVSWVVAVMLPPMAIFFPLFTLLEDYGYLPRVAFNLDTAFKKCKACGKQALTMCMGFGCNAAAIIGCRIIDSPRERMIAMLTNNFVPCNGRFPTLIAIITMFFVANGNHLSNVLLSSVLLVIVIMIGILMTFLISRILSETILKGMPSFFTLELPPFRRPQLGKVIIRSIFDRTLFVLGRALAVAAPAGLLIWIMANVQVGNESLLIVCSDFLDPFAKVFGLDGVILMAFILGLPANEIVIPIILMAYLAKGQLVDMNHLESLKTVLVDNGWTWITALCTMLFSLLHWPCSTTLITIYKESKSIKWGIIAFLIPTVCAFVVCFIVAQIGYLL